MYNECIESVETPTTKMLKYCVYLRGFNNRCKVLTAEKKICGPTLPHIASWLDKKFSLVVKISFDFYSLPIIWKHLLYKETLKKIYKSYIKILDFFYL